MAAGISCGAISTLSGICDNSKFKINGALEIEFQEPN